MLGLRLEQLRLMITVALDASPTHDKQDVLSGRPHLEYEDKRHAAIAAAFPVSLAYDGRKNLGRAAVDFPLTLESLEWKVDSLAFSNCLFWLKIAWRRLS